MDSPKRHRPPRLPGHDYSTPGYYFVTFNTNPRNHDILAAVTPVVPAALGGPLVTLTPIGEAVKRLIEHTPYAYPDVRVDCYVIMPDHVHLIVILNCMDGPPRAAGTTSSASLGVVVNALKTLSTKQYGKPLWQSGYYDHIIRNDSDLREIRQYIRDNPTKWTLDRTDTDG